MPSLHSAANLRGNENALRRMHPIEEAEAKGKGHVKNNGRAKYKDKNTKASKPPAGSKGYHRWKKKETTKPTPKSQEKEKSPKRGILKFSKKEANPTLNSYSESEIMGKKKSKGKAMQEVPRKVRFHHVSPTRPVSGSSNDSSYTKRSRGGNATVSAGTYTGFSSFPQPTFPPPCSFNFGFFFFFFGERKLKSFVLESLLFPIPSVLFSDFGNQCMSPRRLSLVVSEQMLTQIAFSHSGYSGRFNA